MTATWHVDDAHLDGWTSGTAGPVVAASVEQHLLRCAGCRARVTTAAPVLPDLDDVWTRVRDEIELPRPSLLERFLVGLRLPAGDAKLIATAPSLRSAWLAALLLAVLFPVAATAWSGTRLADLFLLLAPLVPVAGVALSYSEYVESAREQESAAPFSPLRLVLLRTLAVLVVCVPLLLVAGSFVPGDLSWLWLLPALGFTAVVLGLSTWTEPTRPAAAVALLWVAAVGRAAYLGDTGVLLSDALLVTYLAATAAGLLVLVLRTRRLGTLGGTW
jgi:hypothetical protein